MKMEEMFDCMEECKEMLESYYFGWLLSKQPKNADQDAVIAFVLWAKEEISKDQHVKRGREGLSYSDCKRK